MLEVPVSTRRKEYMGNMHIEQDIRTGKVQWSRPMGLKTLSQIFDVHRNTMSKWLRKQIIRNQQMSPRRWRIATFEIPNEIEDDRTVERLFMRQYSDYKQ